MVFAAGLALGAIGLALAARLSRTEGAPTANPVPATSYVVQKMHWEYVDRSEPMRESEPAGAGRPVAVFGKREAAEAHRATLEEAARPGVNPFDHPFQPGGYGTLSFPALEGVTTTPTGEFIDWAAAEGLNPPEGQKRLWEENMARPKAYREYFVPASFAAWRQWWEAQVRGDEARERRVWDRLDRVRFFAVVEVEGR